MRKSQAMRKSLLPLALVLLLTAQYTPWNCGYAGRSLLLAMGSLVVSTASGNPFAVFLSSFAVANSLSNYAACKEANQGR